MSILFDLSAWIPTWESGRVPHRQAEELKHAMMCKNTKERASFFFSVYNKNITIF